MLIHYLETDKEHLVHYHYPFTILDHLSHLILCHFSSSVEVVLLTIPCTPCYLFLFPQTFFLYLSLSLFLTGYQACTMNFLLLALRTTWVWPPFATIRAPSYSILWESYQSQRFFRYNAASQPWIGWWLASFHYRLASQLWQNLKMKEWEKGGTFSMHRWDEKCTWSNHMWDFSISLRLLWKQIWEKQNSSMWPELNCLRAGSSSSILWMEWWRIRFCGRREFIDKINNYQVSGFVKGKRYSCASACVLCCPRM